LEPPRAHHLL